MLLFGSLVAGAGAVIGLFGGRLGVQLFSQQSRIVFNENQVEAYGPWQRPVIVGLLTSIVTLLAFTLGESEVHAGLIALTCLGASFVSATLYTIGSLALFMKYGPAILDAGERSLAVTIVMTAFLCVCGVLWITLEILGGLVLIAVTVLNGIWLYRLR